MTSWEPLKKGDLVDVVAPGWACRPELVQPACEFLENWGLRVRVPQGLLEPWTFFSNTDEKRGGFLDQALRAKDSKAVWCLRAASGTHRVLPQIFKKAKPAKSKLVIGFSDITALHCAVKRKWNWSSLHGSMLDRLALHDLDPQIVEQLRAVVFGEISKVEFSGLQPMNAAAKKIKAIRGPLLGGNLIVFESLIGTPFLPKTSGHILFFEDIGERGYRLDRSFVHLEQAGVFKGVKAIVLGQFTGGDEPPPPVGSAEPAKNLTPWALENLAAMVKIPVFCNLPVGHGPLQWPLPLGAVAEIRGEQLTVQTGARVVKPIGGKSSRKGRG